MAGRLWTPDEMILALNLYLKTPFGKMHRLNPQVIELARLIGRTASSVAIRLTNYASCDKKMQDRKIAGMKGGKKQCLPYWVDFQNNREALVYESECILARYQQTDIETKFANDLKDIPKGISGKTRKRIVQTRVNQNIFRQIVLANYDNKCGLSGIDIPELLVASHIIPWSENKKERLNPENGICLSSLYDKAFDRGLMSFRDDMTSLFSERLESNVGKEYFKQYFEPVRNKKLITPRKFLPNPVFLEWHRDSIFNK